MYMRGLEFSQAIIVGTDQYLKYYGQQVSLCSLSFLVSEFIFIDIGFGALYPSKF